MFLKDGNRSGGPFVTDLGVESAVSVSSRHSCSEFQASQCHTVGLFQKKKKYTMGSMRFFVTRQLLNADNLFS